MYLYLPTYFSSTKVQRQNGVLVVLVPWHPWPHLLGLETEHVGRDVSVAVAVFAVLVQPQ